MSWNTFFKDYLNFSRAERFGVLVLCGCILLVLTVKWTLPYWTKRRTVDITAYKEEISRFRRAADSVSLAKGQTDQLIYVQSAPDLFYFDPNRITDEEWEKLGLNERQIRNIRNYRAKGGHFKRKEDLKKLYTIPATQYRLLEPYIRIGNESSGKQVAPETHLIPDTEEPERPVATPHQETKLRIELNTADSSLLVQLSGIGPVLAARTIKYRNRIGGFADVAQLGEVYGTDPELVERLASQLSADASLVRKIPVNTATFKDLISHPYLNEQQVRGILNYRKLQNRINNLDELMRNHILEHEDAEKIRPYLVFE
ncbi:MAG: helix-hairpin-helix domain-containing protein [Bacteroidales bacterium]|jgi:DNA uptake protein ComE-like DNA-binding protein|nr:helix-hairpin-helix domain-containing protein [Bacteroidales bacterium]